MTRLRFGVVGCGGISTVYQLPALRRCAHLQLTAIVDLDHIWARKVARRFGVPASYSDYRALVGKVDAVLIATPNTTHADIACTLLEHGIHVLCEKPMATTRAETERMFEASKRSGARLMAAHCLRFSPNLAMLKHIVSTGWLGTVREMSASIGGPYDKGTQRTDFRKQRRLAGGGVLIDLGIHLIDLALWLSSERPCMVTYAGISTQGWEVEDDAGVALEFASTARATLSCSLTHALDNTFTIRGSTGWACAYLYRPTELTLFSEVARVCQKSGLQHMMLPNTPMYDKQIEHFCDAVLSGGEFMIRPDEVCAGIDVIERCYDQGSVGGLS